MALTDLERKVYSRFANDRQARRAKGESVVPAEDLLRLAKLAVETLTTGSASGRRLMLMQRREPDPGCTPEKLRRLAERIEDSYTDMPEGWKRMRDIDAERLYG